VEAVSLRTTRVRGADGTVWHIPNGQILRVGNKSQQWQQALVQALVGPTADLDQAQEVVKEAAEAMRSEERWRRRIVADPELLGVESVTPEATTILISVRTLPEARYPVMRELRARVKAALDAAGVPPPVVPGVTAPAAKRRAAKPKG